MRVKPKALLRIHGRDVQPGEVADVPDSTARKLLAVGLVESTMSEPAENAMKPRAEPVYLGGGWYEYRGQKMRKRELPEQART